jgi:YD repeat-containing protein
MFHASFPVTSRSEMMSRAITILANRTAKFVVQSGLLALLALTALLNTATAKTTEDIWGFYVDLLPGQVFKTFGEAEAALKQPSTNEDAPWLVRGEVEAADSSGGRIVTNYGIPNIEAEEEKPNYYQAREGGRVFRSQRALINYLYSQVFNACSDNIVFTSRYYVMENHGNFMAMDRDYERTIVFRKWDNQTETFYCDEPVVSNSAIRRFRYWVCPDEPPYRGRGSAHFVENVRVCSHDLTAAISAPRYAPAIAPPDDNMPTCVGNPCNPMTGNKTEREIDFQSGTLSFYRTYHSREQVKFRAQLGDRWTHNFAQRLFFSAGSGAYIFWQRDDGEIGRFVGAGGVYRPMDGIGAELRLEGLEWILYQNDGSKLAFAGGGDYAALTWLEDAGGRRTTLTYDSGGRVQSVVGPFGHTLRFTYTAGSGLTAVTDPASNTYQYSYTNGVLTGVTYPDSTSRVYHYENPEFPEHLTGITDENGDRYATFAYDDEWGRVTLTEHHGGVKRFTLTYNADNTTTVTDALGNQTVFAYRSGYDYPERVTWSDGFVTRAYTSYGRTSVSRNANGKFTRYFYDNYHRTRIRDAAGRYGLILRSNHRL